MAGSMTCDRCEYVREFNFQGLQAWPGAPLTPTAVDQAAKRAQVLAAWDHAKGHPNIPVAEYWAFLQASCAGRAIQLRGWQSWETGA